MEIRFDGHGRKIYAADGVTVAMTYGINDRPLGWGYTIARDGKTPIWGRKKFASAREAYDAAKARKGG